MNDTGLHWWSVKIASGNGLVLSGNKPLPEPRSLSPYGVTGPHWVNILGRDRAKRATFFRWYFQMHFIMKITLPWFKCHWSLFVGISLALSQRCPGSKVHGANMGPTWVLSAPDGPHIVPMNRAIRVDFGNSLLGSTPFIWPEPYFLNLTHRPLGDMVVILGIRFPKICYGLSSWTFRGRLLSEHIWYKWTLVQVMAWCRQVVPLPRVTFLSQRCIFHKNSLAKGIYFSRSP